ncbi:hypothetical protein GCM10027300_23290 [Modestobacter lapidis]
MPPPTGVRPGTAVATGPGPGCSVRPRRLPRRLIGAGSSAAEQGHGGRAQVPDGRGGAPVVQLGGVGSAGGHPAILPELSGARPRTSAR